MVYQGSKSKILKDILPFIQSCIDTNGVKCYVEPFVGGANVIDAIVCNKRVGCDNNFELITLLQYMRDNPELKDLPEDCSFEHYADVRENRKQHTGKYSAWYTAAIGYFASYGGRYFDGGYGRDSKGGEGMYKKRLVVARHQAPKLKDIQFYVLDYDDLCVAPSASRFYYCDPPYKGTKVYNGKSGFDYDYFYSWLRQLSKDNFVLISEYSMPDDFMCVWNKEVSVLQKSDRKKGDKACEKLFTFKGGLYDRWYREEKK